MTTLPVGMSVGLCGGYSFMFFGVCGCVCVVVLRKKHSRDIFPSVNLAARNSATKKRATSGEWARPPSTTDAERKKEEMKRERSD